MVVSSILPSKRGKDTRHVLRHAESGNYPSLFVPRRIVFACPRVQNSSHDEQKIRDPTHCSQDQRIDRLAVREPNYISLRSTTD